MTNPLLIGIVGAGIMAAGTILGKLLGGKKEQKPPQQQPDPRLDQIVANQARTNELLGQILAKTGQQPNINNITTNVVNNFAGAPQNAQQQMGAATAMQDPTALTTMFGGAHNPAQFFGLLTSLSGQLGGMGISQGFFSGASLQAA